MVKFERILITCEHGGNDVPHRYRDLFRKKARILSTHRAFDPGALKFAGRIAGILRSPLYYCTTTRLLVDANRSLSNRGAFSEFSRALPEEDREWLIRNVYLPYRRSAERKIQAWVRSGAPVFHLSVHSFTPLLGGVKRNADVGLLYDPARAEEKRISRFLQRELKRHTGLRIRCNYPYLGRSDGFTTALRKLHDPQNYLGMELELNQSLLMKDEAKCITVAEAFCRILRSYADSSPGISNRPEYQ